MKNKENSPFTPGSPVPVELFIGREKQINEVFRYISQSMSGKHENIFLSGDRGIGKSSLASFIRHILAYKEEILGIHVFLGKVYTLQEMVRHIFEELLKETKGQKWFNNISQLFGKYIQEIGLFGISVRFSPPAQELQELIRYFPDALYNLLKEIKRVGKKGLFIIWDDINGLVDKAEFANWYKSFVDEVATHYKDFPVLNMLIGLPEKRDILAGLQPSLMRIFRVVEIEKLSDEEVGSFLFKAFNTIDIKVKSIAMDWMVRYSSGLPILMHEIGDRTFWINNDDIIDENDVIEGIIEAAEEVGKKYIDPKVNRAVRSKHYISILKKLAGEPISRNFLKKDVAARLNPSEKRVFHNFLRRLKELGIIESDVEKDRGAYRFVNEIYPVYIYMVSRKLTKKLYNKNKGK